MHQRQNSSKDGTLAPLKNVVTCMEVAQRIIDQPEGVDRLGLFYGPSGYGKSKATLFMGNHIRILHLEVFDFWTRKVFVESLLIELGIPNPRGTIAAMMTKVLELLRNDPDLLLVIDEADKLVDKGFIEIVRDVYKGARIPVLLVGEEQLPAKLKAYERCHNRVSAFGMANPCDVEDAQVLAKAYQPHLEIADDLLVHVVAETRGVASQIVATLADISQFARVHRRQAVDKAAYTGPIFTGRAPTRRAA